MAWCNACVLECGRALPLLECDAAGRLSGPGQWSRFRKRCRRTAVQDAKRRLRWLGATLAFWSAAVLCRFWNAMRPVGYRGLDNGHDLESGAGEPQSKTLSAGSGGLVQRLRFGVRPCSAAFGMRCGRLDNGHDLESGAGEPQSKTLSAGSGGLCNACVLECGRPLPLFLRRCCPTLLIVPVNPFP